MAAAVAIPRGGELVLHFDGAESPVDGLQEFQTATSGTPSVHLREDDVLRAGQVSKPVDLELVCHQLVVWTAVTVSQKFRHILKM